MNQCYQLCRKCSYSYTSGKRLICENGYFDVLTNDSYLLVSWDFDCKEYDPIEKEEG
jgi:hypothetical protein